MISGQVSLEKKKKKQSLFCFVRLRFNLRVASQCRLINSAVLEVSQKDSQAEASFGCGRRAVPR